MAIYIPVRRVIDLISNPIFLRKIINRLDDAEIYFLGKTSNRISSCIKRVDKKFYPVNYIEKENKFKLIVSNYIIKNYILNTSYKDYDHMMNMPIVKNNIKYIDWNYLSRRNLLSKVDLDIYENYINWDLISQFYKMNSKFILDHKDKLKWGFLKRNKYISHSLLKELKIYFMDNTKLNTIKSKKYKNYYFKNNKKIRKFKLKNRYK